MSKKISLNTTLVLVLLAILITFQLSFFYVSKLYEKKLDGIVDDQQLYEKLKNIESLFGQKYIGTIDDGATEDSVIRGYIAGTGDPYANYMNAEEFAEYVKINSGSSVGIGIRVVTCEDHSLQIVTVLPSSPAEEAGLLPGDRIVRVDGVSTAELGSSMAKSKIHGDAETTVTLSVIKKGQNFAEQSFTVERRLLKETTVTYRMYDDKVGIIRILEFTGTTPTGVKNAYEALKKAGAERILFDVRSNPGGDLDGVVETLDYLLPEGPIVKLVDRSGAEEIFSSDAKQLNVPMVVLIDGNTASAAELFAKALSDYNKATLVGVTTFGKGVAQSVIRLPDNSAVSISTHTYYPPYSENYDGVGVEPDEEVRLSDSASKINVLRLPDSDDAQLLRGVEILYTLDVDYQ